LEFDGFRSLFIVLEGLQDENGYSNQRIKGTGKMNKSKEEEEEEEEQKLSKVTRGQ